MSNGRGLVRGRVKRKMQNHHLYNDIPGLTGSHLYEAARSNDPVGVKLCLLATDTCDINYQQKPDLWTSLIRAAHDGHTKIVEMLLEKKPDVNMKTALGRTALHMAAHGNRLEIARMLIDARADVIAADVAGRTPVDLARSYGDDTPLIKVMEPVAEVKRRSGGGWAAHRHKISLAVELAAELQAQVGGRERALRRLVAAPDAMFSPDDERSKGAGVMETPDEDDDKDEDEDAVTLIMEAAKEGKEGGRKGSWKSASLLAAAFGKVKALKVLIKAGADVNATENQSRNTMLHWAVLHHKLDAVEVLVKSGADVCKRNRDGMGAIDIARDMPFPEALAVMEQTPKGKAYQAARIEEEEKLKIEEARERGRRHSELMLRRAGSSYAGSPTRDLSPEPGSPGSKGGSPGLSPTSPGRFGSSRRLY